MKKSDLFFILIFLLAVFMRFYKLPETFVFGGEIGHDYLEIKNYLIAGKVPLIGPPTSHPWLSFGPLFYWIMMPVLYFFKYDPLSAAYFMEILSLAAVYLNYTFISKLFNRRTALLSSLFIAVSPLWLWFGHEGRFFSIVPLLFYPFLYFLMRVSGGEYKFMTGLGLVFGIMLNFHMTPLILLPAVIYIVTVSTDTKRRWGALKNNILKFLAGITFPSVPFLIYDAGHRFSMLSKLFLWIPYKVLSFLGIRLGNEVLSDKGNLTGSGLDFLRLNFLENNQAIGIILGTVLVILSIREIIRIWRTFRFAERLRPAINLKKRDESAVFLLLIIFFSGLGILFIHGRPPLHYFVPLLSMPLILTAFFIDKFTAGNKSPWTKAVTMIAVLIVLTLNSSYFFSKEWYYRPFDRVLENQEVPYPLFKQITGKIVTEARGRPYNLKRVGVYNSFPDQHASNYRYLAWVYGNEPTDKKVDLQFTVYEDIRKLSDNLPKKKIITVGNVIITENY